jgi:phenylacetic acid degradation protein PaaD
MCFGCGSENDHGLRIDVEYSLEERWCRAPFSPAAFHEGPPGIVHGGFLATLADSAFAVACNTYGEVTVAAGFDIVFVASTVLGEELTAEAVERARYGRSGLYDVSVRAIDPAGDVRLVAEFRGRSRSLGRPFPSIKAAPEETT